MIFAIPAAVQGASLALKILITVTIVGALLGAGFYFGKRWEISNTISVQAQYDKFVSDTESAGNKQTAAAKLENQRLKLKVEIANVQNNRARDSLVFYADKLQQLSTKSSRASIMPLPSTDPASSGLTCFDGAELIAADERYRAGEAERRTRIHRIAKEGAENTADLDTVKLWKQSLPVNQKD